ncbi:MAG: DUF4876 domain-containing protein [Prevotellaceae bacterium]|jgi:hypothetical protein|nr:DUF4876 domain-containing protein [Prevotellaceae bacterium]
MKKTTIKSILLYAAALVGLAVPTACEDEITPPPEVKTFTVSVQLVYPDGFAPAADVRVVLRNIATGAVDEAFTDADGVAAFVVIAGIFEATASEERADALYRYLLNGAAGNIVVTEAWTNDPPVDITLTVTPVAKPSEGDASPYGKLVIKELYIGGCQKDDGSGAFQRDPYIVLYNNSTQPAALEGVAFSTCFAHNAHGTNYFFVDNALIYAADNWLPASYGAWYIPGRDTLAPGEQIVIAMNAAIDHTGVYSNSINFASPDYYVAYHPESGYSNTTYHPAPSEVIPTSHYLRAIRLAGVTANAWTFSVNSPAFFIFLPRDNVSLIDFSAAPENIILHSSTGSASQGAIKVPRTWVIDGIEVFQEDRIADSKKRMTADIDVGYIPFTNSYGHTLYRNVDKAATEAILGNAGKIVYDYALGWEESTDPSGIDAEASIRNGAHIIYKDSNNASNDFHQRSRASLRP